MAQNFLYMLEFVVDELIVTRPNQCAPEEYPTCCEITFRSHVFISICDKEFGAQFEAGKRKGKCCLFSLEAPISNKDRLQIHVFKKRNDNCKFLIGATEIPVHRIFDKVTNDFFVQNPTWDAHLNDPKRNSKALSSKRMIDNDCGAATSSGRKEELTPTYEINKKLLPLSNISGNLQTGNIVLIMRLACMGPTIVSPFQFGNMSNHMCCPKPKVSCKKDKVKDSGTCKRYFSLNAEKGCPCEECEDDCDRLHKQFSKEDRKSFNNYGYEQTSKGCPCPECDEKCQKEETNEDQNSEKVTKPYVIKPTKPEYGPEKYDEYEANLNGSGLTIRVLKDKYMVEKVCDVDDDILSEKLSKNKVSQSLVACENLNELIKSYPFMQNHIKRKTRGNILNNKALPIVRGNIKYPENDSCYGDFINIPLLNKLPSIKSPEAYRKKTNDIRNCCFQVQPSDIDNTLRGINAAAKRKGIEVCHKSCEDPDTDVFLVKLGNKKSSQSKKNTIEIELRTPKEPLNIRPQKWTKETQVDEAILDANMKQKKQRNKKVKRNRRPICF